MRRSRRNAKENVVSAVVAAMYTLLFESLFFVSLLSYLLGARCRPYLCKRYATYVFGLLL